MNSYERRKRILKLHRELRQQQKRLSMMEQQDKVMLQFEIAFKDTFGHYPQLAYHNGWYCLRGSKGVRRFREEDLIFEANRLWARKHQEELGGNGD